MKILLTGASGFLGKAIVASLAKDHELISLGRSSSNAIRADLSTEVPSLPEVDLIIHAAGKAHVIPKTAEEKQEFFDVNEAGTVNLLKGITANPKAIIFVSTVAVYGKETGKKLEETAPLLGDTPYAQSKINAENSVKEWAESNAVNYLIIRIPLVVGKDAPGNLGAMIKAIKAGYYFRLGSGEARKSMVLAADIAKAIPMWTDKSGIFNLTDGAHPSLAELDEYIADKFGKKVKKLPLSFLKIIGKLGDYIPGFPLNSYRIDKLSNELTFSDQKARRALDWKPSSVIGTFIP
ncbi:NAD-dependent epimerase/dehydratase family protein [Algoriphagus chordae]|uniref:Nucleoside-diphosphate-sugar epimerase n=1 Tax=Algoriphagus chordae TaxID=237019 RepID=A0A2W7QGL9_9BACT|nr:NAD-dependent epimerase/dehydratase family protein [Algoriphagus chordae]PZX47668.1 nucleoside-diphosphate-sugar epimerase [Algoriphagus chordae]